MNYNNNNNNNNTMNYNASNNDNSPSSDSSNAKAAIMRTPASKLEPGTPSALYKLAARNLRESHGVPSMTALKLEKTVALLRLAPRRVVVQGLAPRRLLKGDSSPLVLSGEGSGQGEEELRKTETGELADPNGDVSNDSDRLNDDHVNGINNNGGGENTDDVEVPQAEDSGKGRRPIHAVLVAGGINLRPSETRPLLRALGVRPHRLVRLGLVKREALRAMPGRRGGAPGQRQHLRTGGPGKGGVGRPHGPPHGPPHDHGGRSLHAPPRSIDGDGHGTTHLGEENNEEGASAPLGPHGGPGHRGPRHQGGRLQGPPHEPGHRGMSTRRHGRGPPGGGKHGHGHGHHPPHGHGQGHSEGEGGEGKRLHRPAPGPEQLGPRRRHGGGMDRSIGRPHGPFRGPFREGGASGGSPGVMAHARHGPPSRAGGGMKQRGGRQGGMMFCGGGGGGGGHRQRGRMAHPAHFDDRHQAQVQA